MKHRWIFVFLSAGVFFSVWGCQGFDEQILYNKAGQLHNDGRIAEAIKIYQQLLEADPHDKVWPENAIVRYDLGIAHLDMGKRAKAVEQIQALRKMKRADLADELERAMDSQ